MDAIQKRFTLPSRYDLAPFGSMCCYIIDDSNQEIYMQVSEDSEKSQWERMGNVLEKAFVKQFEDKKFVSMVLRLYTQKEPTNINVVL